MAIVEFLEARIAEDEQAADTEGESDRWQDIGTDNDEQWGSVIRDGDGLHVAESLSAFGPHIARHDPARVLRECAAKRKILGLAQDIAGSADEFADQDYKTLTRTLASVYSDHPDFDPEWRMTSM